MKSSRHVRAIVKGTNGELGEDIRESDKTGQPKEHRLDSTVEATFPASDPSSNWAGATDQASDDEVVHVEPIEEIPGRERPSDPVPGTVPRDVGR
jgi:hypothetical protein